ncbi:uncharacterized protein LY89DRAFT_81330 [Mollisia scopiformis]|uniref:2EXR domain-containing protein n=1 Tax=Mollisia scopiformis TaxID=149040 RepID=A0A194X9B6_MOLSC|nr:uncharacterized protein LY89DRAFT_81330 [Mollisia scopiformis]KUJ16377.1 hypothetical protein LY89DRAFT_81330 [Mollisia scopiformis]
MATRIMYFMYHHCQYCTIGKETLPEPSPDSFTLFPLLPFELRLKVWYIIANTPRTVELTCTPSAPYMPEGKWFSHSKSPVIFRICSESRTVAQSSYSTLDFSPDQLGIPCRIPLLINFAADTLWLCQDLQKDWARDLLEKNEHLREKLKFLAVKEKLWKELNEVELTPIPELQPPERTAIPKNSVFCGLKAIEDVKFHD